MKILHILDHSIPLHSGYAFRTRSILEQQRRMGWQTCHVTSLKQGASTGLEEKIDGLLFHRTRSENRLFASLPVLNQLDVILSLQHRIDELVADEKPDILHAHSPALNGIAALRVARRHKLPVVYEVRAFWEDAAVDHGTSREGGLRYRCTRALETHVLRHVDAVTTICEGLRKDLIARGIPASKVTVIPNAVEPAWLQAPSLPAGTVSDLQKRYGLPDAGKLLGFIGSFYAYEGIPLLIEALAYILDQCPDTHLLLVGGGPQEAEIRNLIVEKGLSGRITLTGRVPHDDIIAFYELLDICVYPRLSMRLTDLVTPLKPLEAMARQRLVIASDVGGHRELIRDGETGFLFEAGDRMELAKVVVKALRSPETWPDVKRNAFKYVSEERTWEKAVARYRNVYAGAGVYSD